MKIANNFERYYTISFHQKLKSRCLNREEAVEDTKTILEAADTITRLVEEAMLYWGPEWFPMIW